MVSMGRKPDTVSHCTLCLGSHIDLKSRCPQGCVPLWKLQGGIHLQAHSSLGRIKFLVVVGLRRHFLAACHWEPPFSPRVVACAPPPGLPCGPSIWKPATAHQVLLRLQIPVTSSSPPSLLNSSSASNFKGSCDYNGPAQIIQNNMLTLSKFKPQLVTLITLAEPLLPYNGTHL